VSFRVMQSPAVRSLEPGFAMPGDVISVRGEDLDAADTTVRIGDAPARIEEASAERLRVKVPEQPFVPERNVTVSVQFGGGSHPQQLTLALTRLPEVAGINPPVATVGDRVTLAGRGFDPKPGGNLVTFGGQPALVLRATDTELTVSVPPVVGRGAVSDAPVVVQAMRRPPSAPAPFSLSHPAAAKVVLRYYPVPVPDHPGHDHAYVATDLGPVLLLTGPGGSTTTAERAHSVATALNALLGGDATLAFADGGGGLARPTSDDVAGYAETWGAEAPAVPPSAEDVGAWWLALLEDYRTLFGRGERPARLLRLQSRADVLSAIYDRALKLQPEGTTRLPGVPTRLCVPPSPELSRRIRDLALLVPPGRGGTKP
jgi:hypothetical protein